jgi:hypothetical protein
MALGCGSTSDDDMLKVKLIFSLLIIYSSIYTCTHTRPKGYITEVFTTIRKRSFEMFTLILSTTSVTSHCNDNSIIIHFVTIHTPFYKLSAPHTSKQNHIHNPSANAARDGRRPSFLLALPNHHLNPPLRGLDGGFVCLPKWQDKPFLGSASFDLISLAGVEDDI